MHNNEVKVLNVAVLGNPNCGKSSIFNKLTGLRQKVGNFPGVTVDKKVGYLTSPSGVEVKILDFPGTYSLYPNSQDERIVVQSFTNPADENYPDVLLYVVDVTKLEKHLLLFTQLCDLGLPVILVLNMADIAEREGMEVDAAFLREQLKTPVIKVSARTGSGIAEIGKELDHFIEQPRNLQRDEPFYPFSKIEQQVIQQLEPDFPGFSPYQLLLLSHHYEWLSFLDDAQKDLIKGVVEKTQMDSLRLQVDETMRRFDHFTPIALHAIKQERASSSPVTDALDRVLTHRILGPVIFMVLMLFVFQAIYAWATYPMDWIEGLFGWMTVQLQAVLPDGWFSSLLTDGVLAGLGGIMVFIPQIAILFLLISILEEVGYMARAAYMFDRLMQTFGLNGRSIVALISGGACAIPAIMSTRTIGNWKERLITILVTPFISCSARIPVYTVLIGFVVPATTVWGIFNLQGLAFMGLYLLGIIAALGSAFIFKLILRTRESSFLMLELPEYRTPVLRNVGLTVWEKVKTFIVEAGKIIMIISVVLWVLASYGPPKEMAQAVQDAEALAEAQSLDEIQTADLVAAKQIEASFAGHLGKFIEPAIQPLGFDWKMGIALITSFAAREVFIGTMATIYSIGSKEDEFSIRDRMARERDPETGLKVYTMATSLSLLIFYVFAMQCMSTLAVVRRETKSWKWPVIQFVFMTALAYFGSLLVYQLFS